jgi:hypothetical protein
LGEYVGLGITGEGAFPAISPVESLRSSVASGLADGLASMFGDEFVSGKGAFAKDAESTVLSFGFSSEGEASSGLFASEEVREVVSPGRSGSAGGASLTPGTDFWALRRRSLNQPRPTVSPTVKLTSANKSSSAAAN